MVAVGNIDPDGVTQRQQAIYTAGGRPRLGSIYLLSFYPQVLRTLRLLRGDAVGVIMHISPDGASDYRQGWNAKGMTLDLWSLATKGTQEPLQNTKHEGTLKG